MRYLPPHPDIGSGQLQFGWADVQALELFEVCLISNAEVRTDRIVNVLLQSPGVLIWSVAQWLNSPWSIDGRNTTETLPAVTSPVASEPVRCPAGGWSDDQLRVMLGSLIESHLCELIRDNAVPLSSIRRVGLSEFAEVTAFFSLVRAAEGGKMTADVGGSLLSEISCRLHLIESRLAADEIKLELAERFDKLVGIGSKPEKLLVQFGATEFSGSETVIRLLTEWEMEIPLLRDGFGNLEARLQRLHELEVEFERHLETEKLEAMRQLAYGASHEVNNPLANISTRAQALLRDETDTKRRQRLLTIDAQAFRAHDMISNLMAFARPPRPGFQRLQLRPLVEAAIAKLAPMAEIQGTEIRIEVPFSIYFDVDRNQLDQMIFAMVQNSMEALRQSGNIRVQATSDSQGGTIHLHVIDSGPGISPEVRRHIFDPFFSGREAGRGLGFGLSKVWRLMQLHRGQIRVNEVEQGADLELIFPSEQSDGKGIEAVKTA